MKIVFVATYPKGNLPIEYLEEWSNRQDYILVHPSYNINTPEGQKLLTLISDKEMPKFDKFWSQVCIRDYWLLKNSKALIYDVDADPGTHFLAIAIDHQIPIYAISSSLRTIPAYFSGFINLITTPENIVEFLDKDFDNNSFSNRMYLNKEKEKDSTTQENGNE